MNSPFSNGSGRLGELPAALDLLATAGISEENLAEAWPAVKVKFSVPVESQPDQCDIKATSKRVDSQG